ncbi:MAG TPA: MauE/DoxX family redox-associated membrane protein [Verrucomicrobiales bacterium]|nr:MauE/DoxX family redox-associated membrane protein [Verrucomicrobiales bacterium]
MISLPRTAGGVVALTLRMLLGAFFIYTGWLKTQNFIVFLNDIRSFQILEDPCAAWLAMGLPWLEILAGAALVIGVLVEGGLAIIAGMLAVFIWALAYSWQRGLDIQCGCFGKEAQNTNYTDRILQDAGLLAVAVGLLIYRAMVRRKGAAPGAAETASS